MRLQILIVHTVICTSACSAFAGAESYDSKAVQSSPAPSPVCETPKEWEFRVGVPGWIPLISGDFGTGRVVAPVEVSFKDIVGNLDAIAVLSLYLRHNRWEVFGDGQYLAVSDSVTLPGLLFTDANIKLKTGFWETFLGYRLINCEKGSLSIFAGGRYNYAGVDFDIANNNDPRFPALRRALGIPDTLRLSGSKSWVDPVVGIGGKFKVAKAVSLYGKADVGGFTVASDWAYQIGGGVEFQISRWFYTDLGWRYFQNDYSGDRFTNKTSLNGPFFQAGVSF
jgi:hypothetical protein